MSRLWKSAIEQVTRWWFFSLILGRKLGTTLQIGSFWGDWCLASINDSYFLYNRAYTNTYLRQRMKFRSRSVNAYYLHFSAKYLETFVGWKLWIFWPESCHSRTGKLCNFHALIIIPADFFPIQALPHRLDAEHCSQNHVPCTNRVYIISSLFLSFYLFSFQSIYRNDFMIKGLLLTIYLICII